MKLHLKYIVTLVIAALVCIFAYQTYWLVGLYQSQEKEVEAKIKGGMEYAHFMEMKKRIERLRNDDKGPHRQLTGAVAFSMDEDDDIDQKVKVKKVRGGKIVQSVQTTFTKQEKRSEDDKDQELMMMMSGKLATMVQQALFGKLNEIAKPDINDYDSAWVAKMLSDSLLVGDDIHPLPHQIQLFAGKKVLAKVTTKGYVPSANAKQYQYVVCNEGEANEEKYVLTLEPLTMTVLSQMAGILATSLFIMLILAFVFWFLIHTMLKQKTLDEMKSDFTNNITHELKTPIAVAYAATDSLLNYGMLQHPDKARKYLTIAQEQLQTLSGLVEQILSMSMERRKSMLLNIVEVPMKEVIEPLISQHQLKVNLGVRMDKKVNVSLSVEPENLMVHADRMHFSNIVSNLIDNAIKYSEDSVKIEIKAFQKAEDEVLVSVSDNGIGIAHDKLPYIFDKFYRVTDGNKYTVKGYGLGLFYVKSLMEKMGGSVSVESEPGKGSCFTLHFLKGKKVKSKRVKSKKETMNKIKVLLVEDETSLAMILSDTLEAQGFEMRTAHDGEEGLRMFDEQKPDVLVADVMMPKMDGFEMVRRIRKTDSRTPVLFLTARSAVNDVVEGFELGGNDYLKKPFAIQELIVRIKSLCHRASAGNISSEEQEGGNVSPDNPDAADQWLSIGRYRLNVTSQILQLEGKDTELSHRESEILRMLVESKNNVVESKDILLQLWGDDSFFNSRSLHVFITKLRHKLSADENIRIINVRGIGYKMIC